MSEKDYIPNGHERMAVVETDVHHIKEDLGEMKGEQKEARKAMQSMSESLSRLVVIVEQNQKLEPRLKIVEDKLSALSLKVAGISTAVAAIWALAGDAIKAAIF